ncbi:MAG: hypothetical protein LBB74_07155 [Chitinispirillales bacterium]|jgi:hypothetical protein|nr:hypothetical protein [Chitinispirillales bacterium]
MNALKKDVLNSRNANANAPRKRRLRGLFCLPALTLMLCVCTDVPENCWELFAERLVRGVHTGERNRHKYDIHADNKRKPNGRGERVAKSE